MASISLYNENQLCKIIKPAGAPNQLFYIHEVPEIVKILTGNDSYEDDIQLELYPIIESTESSNIKELNVESLIVKQDCKSATFDFGKLFDTLFLDKENTELNFIDSFESSSNFTSSTIKMSDIKPNTLQGFNRRYKHLNSNYLQSHMSDTFSNVVLDSNKILSETLTYNNFLSYNMVYAWTEYIKTMYDVYIDKIWNMLESEFSLKQSDYSWNAEELLKTPKNVSKVVNNTYNNECAANFLNKDIFDTEFYTSLNPTEQIKFKYAASTIFIIISQPINNIVKYFENMLNTNELFKFDDLLDDSLDKEPEKISTNLLNFISWFEKIHRNFFEIKTEVLKDDLNKKSQALSSIYPKLKYSYILNQWTPKFIKNVNLILLNSDKISSTNAVAFCKAISDNKRKIDNWEEYYSKLYNEFSRISTGRLKTLEDDLVNDLITSIGYENIKGDNDARIQKQFYDIFGIYNKNYKIQPSAINKYLNEKIDNKKIITYAIESRFKNYEFKTTLEIIKNNADDIFNIIENKNSESLLNYYTNSTYYTQIISLYETSSTTNFDSFFKIYNDSITQNDENEKYVCEFDNSADYASIVLDDTSTYVFSSSGNNAEKLFNRLKNNSESLTYSSIQDTISKINNVETSYLKTQLNTYTIGYTDFNETIAKREYNIYCTKYSNKFILYDIEKGIFEDKWDKPLNEETDKTPKSSFGEILSKYYVNVVDGLAYNYNVCKDSDLVSTLRLCVNKLTNYLYDTGFYGKTSGLSDTVSRSIIIDSTLNRTLSFDIPMAINNKKIFEIIDELENKIIKIESNQAIDKDKFDENVKVYEDQLKKFVKNCADENLDISISNYKELRTLVIPDEYKNAISVNEYYTNGKTNLCNGSIQTLTNKIDSFGLTEEKIEEVKNDYTKYDSELYNNCSEYYASISPIIDQYASFLKNENFDDVLTKIETFKENIENYKMAYEENKPQVDEEQPTDAPVVGEEEKANKNM